MQEAISMRPGGPAPSKAPLPSGAWLRVLQEGTTTALLWSRDFLADSLATGWWPWEVDDAGTVRFRTPQNGWHTVLGAGGTLGGAWNAAATRQRAGMARDEESCRAPRPGRRPSLPWWRKEDA